MARFVFRKSMLRKVVVSIFVVAIASFAYATVPADGDRRKGKRDRGPTLIQKLAKAAKKAPLVVAHRGDSKNYPENTISAFQSAVRRGSALVEFDFRVSKDGVLYCMHDDTLDRTTNVERVLKRKDVKTDELTMDELHALDAGWWKSKRFKETYVPTVEDALAMIIRGSTPMIEHKEGPAGTLVHLLRKENMVDEVIVQSFDWKWLEEIHALEPELTIAALGPTDDGPDRITKDLLPSIAATGAKMVHWKSKKIDRAAIDLLHEEGYLVCVYTVNEDQDLARCAEMNVDAITTDNPDHLDRLIRRKVVRRPAKEPAKTP